MKDASLQVRLVCLDFVNGYIIVYTIERRLKQRNISHDTRVTISVKDHVNPYKVVRVRGRIGQSTKDADQHISKLAKKCMGADSYEKQAPGEKEVILKIKPDRILFQWTMHQAKRGLSPF